MSQSEQDEEHPEHVTDTGGGDTDRGASAESTADLDPSVPFTQQLGRITVVILAILFGVFALANSHPVRLSWIAGETVVRADPGGDGTTGGVPLIVLLVASFAIGALVGVVTTWNLRRRRRRRYAEEG